MKLKKGDIIAFKPDENSWFNRCIAWLTNSDTCHAAMVYSEDAIVELIASGVCVNPMRVGEGTPVYVLRLKQEQPPEPLVKAADAYIHSGLRFDFPALAILAGLLIYRKIKPSSFMFSICRKIILAACMELDDFIQKIILKNPDGAMVCAQLVYQIFNDCDEEYKIRIVNGAIWSNDNAEDYICIADLLKEDTLNHKVDGIEYEIIDESADELAKQLYHILEVGDVDDSSFDLSNNSDIIEGPAREFIKRCESLQKYLNKNMPLEAMFISAGDMLNHAENLELIGTCDLYVKRS